MYLSHCTSSKITVIDGITGVAEQKLLLPPVHHTLKVTPNPAIHTAVIEYSTAPAARVEIAVYDACGKIVKNFRGLSGSYTQRLTWDITDEQGIRLPAGIYFIRLKTENMQASEKIVLLKDH